jgi:t-SNARE complex subunit (syntaxin)
MQEDYKGQEKDGCRIIAIVFVIIVLILMVLFG